MIGFPPPPWIWWWAEGFRRDASSLDPHGGDHDRWPRHMRLDLIAALALGATMLVSACGSIPQPFRPSESAKKHNEFLLAPLSAGVVVRRVEGPVGWVGDALTQAMAEALRERGIVAGSKWSNKLSLRLSGSGYQKLHLDKAPELVMIWALTDPAGIIKEQRETRITPPGGFWEQPTAAMFRDVAERNAEMVISWIDPTRPERTPIQREMPRLSIAPLEGAPGDGDTSLARAVALSLEAERVPIVATGEAELVVTSRIDVAPAPDNTEDVSITWILSKTDGTEIGRVAQRNQIPKGELDGRWGAIAVAIADGAADGIAGLARAYRDNSASAPGQQRR